MNGCELYRFVLSTDGQRPGREPVTADTVRPDECRRRQRAPVRGHHTGQCSLSYLCLNLLIHVLKRALSQKRICGLFTKWPAILWMGLVSEISCPEMKSISGNDNRRVKQTMLYFMHDILRILLFSYHNFLKTIWIAHFVVFISQFLENDMDRNGSMYLITFK